MNSGCNKEMKRKYPSQEFISSGFTSLESGDYALSCEAVPVAVVDLKYDLVNWVVGADGYGYVIARFNKPIVASGAVEELFEIMNDDDENDFLTLKDYVVSEDKLSVTIHLDYTKSLVIPGATYDLTVFGGVTGIDDGKTVGGSTIDSFTVGANYKCDYNSTMYKVGESMSASDLIEYGSCGSCACIINPNNGTGYFSCKNSDGNIDNQCVY